MTEFTLGLTLFDSALVQLTAIAVYLLFLFMREQAQRTRGLAISARSSLPPVADGRAIYD